MHSSIGQVTFGILSTVFLTGIAIATRNVVKINRSNAARKKRIKEYEIEKKMTVLQLQKPIPNRSKRSV